MAPKRKSDDYYNRDEEDPLWQLYHDDADFVKVPEGVNPETDPKILSEIVDEVVILMKDARDEAAYDFTMVTKVPRGKLGNIIYCAEVRYGLKEGTIKESTVLFRLKAYRKKKDHKMSRLKEIEADLGKELVLEYHFRKKQNQPNPSSAFHCGVAVRCARRLLESAHPQDEDRRTHHFAVDYVQLNADWHSDFLSRFYSYLEEQEGVSVFGFPEALEYYQTYGWNSSKWPRGVYMEYCDKHTSYRKQNNASKTKEDSASTTTKENTGVTSKENETIDSSVNASKENNVNVKA